MVTIAISGLHGAGKTTAAKALSEKFGLRYVSAGTVFRQMAKEQGMSLDEFSRHVEEHPEIDQEIDRRSADEAKSDNVLIDARLAGWMAEGADLKILLAASLEARIRRIAKRENRSLEEVRKETLAREQSEAKRYKKLYGIDVDDYSVFDLVLNTENLSEEEMVQVLKLAVEQMIRKKG
jgi:cytidylate kinase